VASQPERLFPAAPVPVVATVLGAHYGESMTVSHAPHDEGLATIDCHE